MISLIARGIAGASLGIVIAVLFLFFMQFIVDRHMKSNDVVSMCCE